MKRLITICGPTCAGKSTLEARLILAGVARTVSTTTRAPREGDGEKNGVHYHFVSQGDFAAMRDCGVFVESAQFGEHFYGTTIEELDRQFRKCDTVVIVCEPSGAKQIREYFRTRAPKVGLFQLFVDSPPDVMTRRLLRRFLQDIEAASYAGNHQALSKHFDTYAKRLVMMQTVETGWVEEANGYAHPFYRDADNADFHYDLVLDRYDESNAAEIASFVMALAETLPV